MRRFVLAAALSAISLSLCGAVPFNRIPAHWKWVGCNEVAFSYDGTYADSSAFSVNASQHRILPGRKFPAKYESFPIAPEGAENLTYSPDSTKLAFTREGNLFVVEISTGKETALTSDGSDLVMNGYASWVYYEEIFGRPSRYRAFWWSPDSKKLGFYRFDNTDVPMFPIYSPFGQDGTLKQTRYPKAGEPNPRVRIGMVDACGGSPVVWADFDQDEDQYFGIPFWGSDSREFFISREPRVQNTLDLYAVNADDGSKRLIYHEYYPTWLDWMENVVFCSDGLYMVRSFETGWQQIYFLSYDGKTLRRLTDGNNWRATILRVDERKGDVYFVANRDAIATSTLYKVDRKGIITALTDTSMSVRNVSFSDDGRYFVAQLSNLDTPPQIWLYETDKAALAWKDRKHVSTQTRRYQPAAGRTAFKIADMKGDGYDADDYQLPQLVTIEAEDGQIMPATLTYPKDFDPSHKYPVHMDLYGGPDAPSVSNSWRTPGERSRWFAENGIINIIADSRVAGHTGRAGTDLDHRDVMTTPVADFVRWADWLKSLPYVQGDKIGVEGFSFGGAMTAMLVITQSESFHYGIAGGGVYDWNLYDSHYTERFMDTPANNPDGYEKSRVISYASEYPVDVNTVNDGSVMLRLTHGTADDNVHFQNTLQLIDALQRSGKKFEFMIYPDGMHGYRGEQSAHCWAEEREFWLKYLCGR